MDMLQLKKERDELKETVKTMQNSLESLTVLVHEQGRQLDFPKLQQPILTRLNALEQSPLASQLQDLQKELQVLKPVQNQLTALEVALPNVQRDLEYLKSVVDQLHANQAETASSTSAKILALENDSIESKRLQESQTSEIAMLKTWKTSQHKTITDDLTKLAMSKAMEKTEEVKAWTRREITEVETRLDQCISRQEQSVQNASSKVNDVGSLAATIQGFPQQLSDICDRLDKTELDIHTTNSTVSAIEQDFQEFRGHTGRIKELEDKIVKCENFCREVDQNDLPILEEAKEDTRRRLRRLEERLRGQNRPTEKAYGETERTILQTPARGQSTAGPVGLERAEQGSELGQSSTPIGLSASVTTLTQNVGELAEMFNSFRHAQKESRNLESRLVALEQRLDRVEEATPRLEAPEDHAVLDQPSEATLAGLEQRILSEIHTVRTDLDSKITNIQLHRSSVPSNAASAEGEDNNQAMRASMMALEAHIKDVQNELDLLSGDFNEAGQKIHEHSATIAVIKDQVPEIFRQQFDPFRSTVEERFGTVNARLDSHTSVLDGLKEKLVELYTASSQALTTKADLQAMTNQVSSIAFALRDLEHRYQNISTEEIHQKMVHWFVQMYPTSSALLRDTAQLQIDANQLKSFCNEIAWVRKHSVALRGLSQHAAQLQMIAQQHSPQYREKIEQVIYDVSQIKAQITYIQEAADQHRRVFDTMNNTLIEPNRDFFGLFGTVLAVLAQLQQVVESLNQNLPGPPLKLHWECFLPSLVERSKTSASSEEEMGKSKQ